MKAAEYAVSLVKKYDAELTILYVLYSELGFAYSNLLGVTTPKAIEDVLDTQKKDVQKWFDEIRSKLANSKIPVTDKIIVSVSSIVGIVGFADKEKMDLIILGTRGRTGFKKLLMGSVAEGVVNHSSCPVRSEEHTSELQSQSNLVCRLLLEKKNTIIYLHFDILYFFF